MPPHIQIIPIVSSLKYINGFRTVTFFISLILSAPSPACWDVRMLYVTQSRWVIIAGATLYMCKQEFFMRNFGKGRSLMAADVILVQLGFQINFRVLLNGGLRAAEEKSC